jgi:hypothetical protein
MKRDAACVQRTGQPRCMQRLEIAMKGWASFDVGSSLSSSALRARM